MSRSASQALWTAQEAAAATGGTATQGTGTGDWQATGVSIDSRKIAPGDLFVALVGPNFDGHEFVADALAGGAAAAVVASTPSPLPANAPLLKVADTMDALVALGRAARARTDARIVAVTGSVGKTSVKEAIALALGRQGPTAASGGSLNNHFGVPLSLARMPAASRFGVFELGMNHVGELTALTAQVRPHVAVITAIEIAHFEFFKSEEAIADAKAEIFTGVEPGGSAVLNRDNRHFDRLAAAAKAAGIERIVGFGADERADVRLLSAELNADASQVSADAAGTRIDYRVGAPGRHWVLNSLAVLAAAMEAGADVAEAARALADARPPAGRGARIQVSAPGLDFEIIDESYNASPASVRAALAVLASSQPGGDGRRIAVLGDMLELGDASADLHAGLAAAVDEAAIDLVFAAGPNMRHLFDAVAPQRRGAHAETAEDLAPIVAGALRPGDVVMVKGSLGSRMGGIVRALADLDRPQPRVVNGS